MVYERLICSRTPFSCGISARFYTFLIEAPKGKSGASQEESNSISAVAIVVPVVLIILLVVLAILGVLFYRRQVVSRLQVVFPTREKARSKYTHTRETLEGTRHEGSALCVPSLNSARVRVYFACSVISRPNWRPLAFECCC